MTTYRFNLAVIFADGELRGFSGASEVSDLGAHGDAIKKAKDTGREFKIVPGEELSKDELDQLHKDWLQCEPV